MTPEFLMRFFYRLFGTVLALSLIGGAVFLLTWDIQPPSAPIKKVIPNERFPS